MNVPLLDLQAQYATIKDRVRVAVDEMVAEVTHEEQGRAGERRHHQDAMHCDLLHANGDVTGNQARRRQRVEAGIDGRHETQIRATSALVTQQDEGDEQDRHGRQHGIEQIKRAVRARRDQGI